MSSTTDLYTESLERRLTNAIKSKAETEETNTQLLLRINQLEYDKATLQKAYDIIKGATDQHRKDLETILNKE